MAASWQVSLAMLAPWVAWVLSFLAGQRLRSLVLRVVVALVLGVLSGGLLLLYDPEPKGALFLPLSCLVSLWIGGWFRKPRPVGHGKKV